MVIITILKNIKPSNMLFDFVLVLSMDRFCFCCDNKLLSKHHVRVWSKNTLSKVKSICSLCCCHRERLSVSSAVTLTTIHTVTQTLCLTQVGTGNCVKLASSRMGLSEKHDHQLQQIILFVRFPHHSHWLVKWLLLKHVVSVVWAFSYMDMWGWHLDIFSDHTRPKPLTKYGRLQNNLTDL